ncbi:hypothetical protein K501DRAFT_288968 [Backusella circina FSU 941]|nr:hypothetical protein K501DRAFT_288968 [Backusella circina FSU 941]
MTIKKNVHDSYLAEYRETIETLPLELQRNYTLIRQLDQAAQSLINQVREESFALSNRDMTLSPEERKEKLKKVGQLLGESVKKGEEKFALAKSTYELVDRHCTRLDNDLQRIEDEQLIGPGRIVTKKRQLEENVENKKASMMKKKMARGRKRVKKSHQPEQQDQQDENTTNNNDANYLIKGGIPHTQSGVFMNDLPIDPNEPLYCFCNTVSFGEMVACDNDECDIEWFHLECVGLKSPPKGKWYCTTCTELFKKKKRA